MIFPSSWSNSGWSKIFEALKGIIGRMEDSAGHRSHDPSTTLVASNLASPSLPQLLPACCPHCGFIGELTAFLLSCVATVSSPAYPALPSSSPVTFSSLEDSSATPKDRLLSQGGSECLDLRCASKGCSLPSVKLGTFDPARFEANIVSDSNVFP